jgi:hypothetical protein
LGIGNVIIIWVLGMLLLFVHWEGCCYLGSGNTVVIWIVEMLLLIVYWE